MLIATTTTITSRITNTVMVNQPPDTDEPFSSSRYSNSLIQSLRCWDNELLG